MQKSIKSLWMSCGHPTTPQTYIATTIPPYMHATTTLYHLIAESEHVTRTNFEASSEGHSAQGTRS